MKRMTIDNAHSEIGFKVKHLMISTVKGKFDTFSGAIHEDGTVFVSINTGSINTGNADRDGHLKSADFFNSAEYNGMSVDPWGNTKHGWEITGSINRNDFGLTWNAPLETGGVLVSEEVKLSMDIQMMEVVEEMETSSPE